MRRDPDHLLDSLAALPARVPPADLRTSLRVIASRERQRSMVLRDFASRIDSWREQFQLFHGELIRSLALPFAGGVFSAVALFSTCVVPTYPLFAHSDNDVPTMLTTQASIKGMAPFAGDESDVVVDVRVDGQGRMIDYAIVSGSAVLANPQMRRRLENALLFSEFTPATTFGQPTAAKMRLWFRSSHIDVKG